MTAAAVHPPEVRQAFQESEKAVRIHNFRVSCILALIFMPAGASLDYLVYPQHTGFFFLLRLACSVLLLFIWWFVTTPLGTRFYRALGLLLPALPCFFICWMIFETNGCNSPYYAGLNLILLGAAILLRWNFRESILVFLEVLAMYLAVLALHHFLREPIGGADFRVLFNNVYFLFVTGVFVAVGSLFYDRLRFSEFALRYELDRNKQTLEEANQKLKELDQIKGRFFANISHELRTPLTLMIAPLETILGRYRGALDENAVTLLQTMQSNGLRLLKLINDLLDLVRLDSGVMQARREPVAMEPFLQGLASAAKQVAEDKRIALTVAVAPEAGTVMVDRDKMEKIIINLAFNALKFTPEGGRVELRADKEDEELVLRVSDSGIGIPEKDLPNVFGRFFQVDSSARRKYQGVGIGLALVKEFTELHGGKVSVQSVEGKGTTFTSRMPYIAAEPGAVLVPDVPVPPPASESAAKPPGDAPAAQPSAGGTVSSQEWLTNLYHRANLFGSAAAGDKAAPSRAVAPAPKNGHAATVLIADDQPDMLRFIQSELAPHYNVVPVTDGQQAVDKAAELVPDIILLDMMMPEKDGMTACREIRAAPATQHVPIVLVTAHVDEETKLNALRAGASDFLPKPFSTTELHVRVKNLVESYEFQRQLARQNRTLETTIDKLKETESLLVQNEKLASLGRLSAGIIHEINNPLNFATTGLFTLRNKGRHLAPEQQADFAEVLRDVEDGIHRVKTIVTDLRGFTHPDMTGVDDVPAAEVVTAALRFVSHESRDQVVVQTNLAAGLTVLGNKNKLIQVLVNLLQNSFDALATKTFASGEQPTITITGRTDGERSLLTVRDNGPGIATENMDKVFDPFFTTKDVGEGMGLGLSICYRIVQDSGGRITVASEPGRFCEFTLEFPLTTAAPATAQP